MDQLIESEMTFGPYPPGDGFRVEDSSPHKAAGEGVKIIDFYKLSHMDGRPPQLWLIEAKTSAPRSSPQISQKFVIALREAGTKVSPPVENLEQNLAWLGENGPYLLPLMPSHFVVSDFALYFSEVREKMENALCLFFATRLGLHPAQADQWPETFQNLSLNLTEVRLLLVVKRAETGWLPPLNDTLRKVMRRVVRTWGLGPTAVEVLTEEMAQRMGLIANVGAP